MTPTPDPQVDALRDAYALVYRCRSDDFEQRVFWKGLNWHAWLPARWFWWTDREFFRPDFEFLRSLGDACSESDLQRALDDLANQGLVERSIRRNYLGIRLSAARLSRCLQPLLPLLRPVEESAPERFDIAASSGPSPAMARPSRTAPADPPQRTALRLRSLKRLHSEIVSGRPIPEALADAELTWAEAEAALVEAAPGRPELAWLGRYLTDMRELTQRRNLSG